MAVVSAVPRACDFCQGCSASEAPCTAPVPAVGWGEKPERLFLHPVSVLGRLAGEGCEKLGSNVIFELSRGWDCKNKRKKLPNNGDTVSLNLPSKCYSPAQNNHQEFPQRL